MSKLGFLLGQYGALALVVAACWGWGEALLRLLKIDRDSVTRLGAPLAITLGLGIGICVMQGLAIAGQLTALFVGLLIAVGMLLGAWQMFASRAFLRRPAWRTGWQAMPLSDRWGLAALAAVLLSTLTAPLPPPTQWDELMYHLPHAQQWAASGHLTVNEWLRYPWFPYDFDLLYAGALLFGNDVLPHLLHALAGWLTAWLIYRLGVQHLDRFTACVAASLWVLLATDEFVRAYVDMGVALFVLVAGASYQAWRSTDDRRWLLPCAFALGLAVGSKYQALTLLPLFAVALIWRDRRPTTWLIVVGTLLIPCIYWYARNALLTGDPFNPMGGKIFGFTDWNAADHHWQFEDLRRARGLPAWPLWPALAVPFIPALRRNIAVRRALILGGYMTLTWAASVPYPRYLLSAYPVLVLLSAAGSVYLIRLVPVAIPALRQRAVVMAAATLLLLYLALMATAEVVRYWKRISPTPEARAALLTQRVPGYPLWAHLKTHPVGRIYQLGSEDSLYYAPQPIWGEVFGPWRYSDYASLPPAQLHRKLTQEHFDALAIHSERFPDVASQPEFEHYFERVWTEGAVKLYKLKPPPRHDAPTSNMLKALLNRRLVQFGMVGIAGLLVDLAVLYLLAPWLGWYLARAASFLAAATCTWALNRTFTFRPAPGARARLSIGREYITYITSMLGGAAINYAVYVLTLHWMSGAAAPTVGVALGSCVGLISNFTAARMLLSRQPTQARMLPLTQWPAASRGQLIGVFTDIDDTLTTEGAITPDALQALAALKAAGLQVVAITGRPVGWSEPFAKTWPLDAIVAENGAVALERQPDGTLRKRYQQDLATRTSNYTRMQQVLARIEREMPGVVRATDSSGRECDIAIDHSEFVHLSQAQIDEVVQRMRDEGMHATVSSIHINGWYGDHDKLVGARWIVRELWGRDLDDEVDRWAYVGDSTNDQLMFKTFAHSIGVANVARFVPQLAHLPHYVTQGERGAGFAEVAAAVLTAR